MKKEYWGIAALLTGGLCLAGAFYYGIVVEAPLNNGKEFLFKSLGIIAPVVCSLPFFATGIEKTFPTKTYRFY